MLARFFETNTYETKRFIHFVLFLSISAICWPDNSAVGRSAKLETKFEAYERSFLLKVNSHFRPVENCSSKSKSSRRECKE